MTDTSADILRTPADAAACDIASVADYFALLKPRVMSLVVFTAFVGLALAPGEIHPWLGAVALVAIAVGAGAAGALNMWYDADIDALMARTALRPVPAGTILPGEALGFGLTLGLGSIVVMGVWVNWMAAGLLAFTIFFYVVIYTMWLKRSTPHNIVIGGAAGAFPPMIGWAAVTGGIDAGAASLFLIIFLWTPPHFWALALLRARDYQRAGVPMLPVVAGGDATRRQILFYSVVLVAASLLPLAAGIAGFVYGGVALALGAAFLWYALAVYRHRRDEFAASAARRLFAYSLVYLFLIFATLLAERALVLATFGSL
jgi:protoheme IX farnesyltransferase